MFEVGDKIQSSLIDARVADFVSFRSTTTLHEFINDTFITEEPWGREIVTNGSVHRYLAIPKAANAVNCYVNTQHGLELRPRKTTDGRYLSGMISSQLNPAFQLHDGEYIRVRARVPRSQGLWPAFWLLPAFSQWPKDYEEMILPEIDPMEYISKFSQSTYSTNVHRYNVPVPVKNRSTLSDAQVKHICPDTHVFHEQFHWFGCYRNKGYIYITLNDKVVSKQPAFVEEIMAGPWCMLLNLAIGGSWPGPPDETTNFNKGFEISKIEVGGYNMLEPIEPDDDRDVIDGPNADIIRDLNKLEDRVRQHTLSAIEACFDERRKELR